MNSKIWQRVTEQRYFVLFAVLVVLTVLAPLVEHTILARVLVGGMVMLTLLVGGVCAGSSRGLAFTAGALACISGVVWIAAFALDLPLVNTKDLQIVSYLLTLSFLITICGIIRKDIYTGSISANKVAGAVCIYVLIGFCFAMVHMMIVLTDPSAYKSTSEVEQTRMSAGMTREQRYPMFVYFSFCTLSTLGYGDIIPANRLSRTVSWLEAISGQLYLAVMMARLVGLHVATGIGSEETDEETETSYEAT